MVKFEQAPDRFIELRRGALKENFGLEVGPFFRPICPKAEGYNSISLDVFSRDELIRNYAKDPNVYPYFNNIEEVDIVSSEPLLNAIKHSDLFKDNYKSESIFDYIITSHHFEHLANPIQFLQAAEQLLKPKGILSMAIPIHTRCLIYTNRFQPAACLLMHS
jgi:SAM-dependent methyltransferase